MPKKSTKLMQSEMKMAKEPKAGVHGAKKGKVAPKFKKPY